MDLMSLPDRKDVVHALTSNALDEFDKQGVNLLNCLVANNHQYADVLKKNGFLNSRVKLQLRYNIPEQPRKTYLKTL